MNGMWFEILFFPVNIFDKWPKLEIKNSVKQEMQRLTFLLLSVYFSYVDIFLPKFSISTDVPLKNILTEMGMVSAFTDAADLSGISEETKVKVS